jgi:hypothetical protein
MKLLEATDDVTGETRYGAEFAVNGVYVYVPINQTNTPESLKVLYQKYVSGKISVKSAIPMLDLFPRCMR